MDVSSYVSQYYKMDPELEDLIRGRDLKNGMEVLIEDPEMRIDLGAFLTIRKHELESFLLEKPASYRAVVDTWNRWVMVTDLEIVNGSVRFIGQYADGTKRSYNVGVIKNWYVKKASIPVVATLPTGDIQEGLEARIFEVVKAAMLKQDSALYHGAPFDILEAAKVLTKQVSKKIEEDWVGQDLIILKSLEEKVGDIIETSINGGSEFLKISDLNHRNMMVRSLICESTNKVLETFGLIPELDETTKKHIENLRPKYNRKRDSIEVPGVDISKHMTDPFVQKIVVLVKLAINTHYQLLLEKGSDLESNVVDTIAKEMTQEILEEVKTEFEAAVEEGYQKSRAKTEARERRYWTGISNTKRPGRD